MLIPFTGSNGGATKSFWGEVKVNIKTLKGAWDKGFALDKHTLSSVYIGDNEHRRPMFDTTRSEAGEGLFRLKYRSDFSQCAPLASAIVENILPLMPKLSLVIPMPASTFRTRQPVNEVGAALAKMMGVEMFTGILRKAPSTNGAQLKNLPSRAEKLTELKGKFSIDDTIEGIGPWNALLLDDLYDSGATMETATAALRTYPKIKGIYVATISWK